MLLEIQTEASAGHVNSTIPIVFGMFDAVTLGNREATSMDQIPPVIGNKDCPKPAYGDVGTLIMGPEDTRGQSCSRRTRCTMTLIAFAGAVWAFCFLATAIAEEKMFSTAANGVPETPKTLVQEIAAIEAQIDAIQEAAIAGIPSLLPGSPQRLQALGKLLFFDKELSVNRNEACAFCHMPQTGYQGAFEKSQCKQRGDAWIGTHTLRFTEASQRGLRRILSSALLRREAWRRKMLAMLHRGEISGTCVQRDCGCTARPPCKRMDRPSIRWRWQIPIRRSGRLASSPAVEWRVHFGLVARLSAGRPEGD